MMGRDCVDCRFRKAAALLLPGVVASLLFLPGVSLAGLIVQNKGPATLEVRFEGENRKIALSDAVRVTLTVEGPADLEIRSPRTMPPGTKWLLETTEPPRSEGISTRLARWRQDYLFSPLEPGKLSLAFPEVFIREGPKDTSTISWEAIEFTVTTQIKQPDLSTIRDSIGIEEVQKRPAEDEVPWQIWLLLGALPIAGWFLFIALRHYFRPKPPRSALERALYEWHRLAALKLPERNRSERFITLLTLILRDYLEREMAFRARRQTTRECVAALRQQAHFTEVEKDFVAEFLECADAVKYADVEMAPVECLAWSEKLHQFLEGRRPNPITKAGQLTKSFPVEKTG